MRDPGVAFGPRSDLADRAIAELTSGPVGTEELARRVLGLRGAPPGLAARLVFELLGSDERASVDADGVWRAARLPAVRDTPLSCIEFAVVDVETTGSAPGRGDRIVEFACVRMRAGRIRSVFETLVDPGVPVPRWITGLTGIATEDVAGAPRFEDIASRVREELRGRVFTAHNVSFDWRFVAAELRRAGAEVPEGERLCTVRLARRAV
ncbi:MAG: exonuclease domain-containing protein, partial [Gemmatimonadota bacterium]|nr:exonuclease domain-containing protein [Gemmatimonadota bacterium]